MTQTHVKRAAIQESSERRVRWPLYGVAAGYYPTQMRGTGSGASIAVGRVGSIAGPLLAGVLLGSGTSAAHVVYYMAPVAAIAGIAVFALGFVRPAQD